MTAEAPLFLLRASSRCRFRGVFFTRPKRCNGITRCLSLPPAFYFIAMKGWKRGRVNNLFTCGIIITVTEKK